MKFFRFYFLDLRLSRKANGFSLIELMVAVGILTLINIMIFASYPEFSQKMALKRTSEEVALVVRQAQAYALGIKRPVSGGDDYFGFGVHFDKSDSKSLVLFADSDSDKTYDKGDGCSGSGTECFQEFKIGTGDYVSELQVCDSSGLCESVESGGLDIIYPRATSMASISADGDVCGSCSYAKVTIQSPRGNGEKNKKYINIWISGQISVE